MMRAVLRNAAHPEYGEATIPFPIPEEEYDHCLELLEALEIGNAVNRDCKVEEIQKGPPVLKRLKRGQSGRVGLSDQAVGQFYGSGDRAVSGRGGQL